MGCAERGEGKAVVALPLRVRGGRVVGWRRDSAWPCELLHLSTASGAASPRSIALTDAALYRNLKNYVNSHYSLW